MKRLVIIYNPRSAGYERVQTEVIRPLHTLKGWTICKYLVKSMSVNQNAHRLSKILQDEDLVVVAGGDGTASVGVNGVMWSEKDVTLGVLGYGNFNDLAHTLGAKTIDEIITGFEGQKVAKMWPLAISVNDQFWRYAACYLTVGLLADSTTVFDQQEKRKKLQQHRRRLVFSLFSLAKWYFAERKHRIFLPKSFLNGKERADEMTDYLAINSKKVANIMKGGDWYLQEKTFWRSMVNMKSMGALIATMIQSVLKRVPGQEVMSDTLEFEIPTTVGVQIEGEYHCLKKIQRITVDKATRSLKVVKVH